jgi:hypothetical protein
MIYYLVTQRHRYTMGTFLESWGRALRDRVRIVPYDDLLQGKLLPSSDASYVFSDLDRVPETGRAQLEILHDRLVDACGRTRVLNDPGRSLLRVDALRTLYAQGVNTFQAFHLDDDAVPLRYPLFIRRVAGSQTAAIPLLSDAREFRDSLRVLRDRGAPIADLAAIEFCDTADARGIFRKYGAFVVGGRIIPRHLFFSQHWMVKTADLTAPELLGEERAYLAHNPHAQSLLRIAAALGITYGRIDYGLLRGRPQIWEVNTNPMIASHISAETPERRAAHEAFVGRLTSAFDALDTATA